MYLYFANSIFQLPGCVAGILSVSIFTTGEINPKPVLCRFYVAVCPHYSGIFLDPANI